MHAKCHGQSTNLHSVWDTGIIVTHVDSDFNGDTQSWASSLVQQIKTGSYKSKATGWISCSSTTEPLSRCRDIESDVKDILNQPQTHFQVTPLQLACPMVWAKESNIYDCVCRDVNSYYRTLTNDATSQTYLISSTAAICARVLTTRQTS